MPANILRLRPERTNNLASIMLGAVRNTGTHVFQDSLFILNEGRPSPFLNLPVLYPPCTWARIEVTFLGHQTGTLGSVPQGTVVPGWGPFGAPLVIPAFTPFVAPLPGAENVILNGAGLMVGLPLPQTQPGGTPGVMDCFSLPGHSYRIDFKVTPLATAEPGLYTWEFSLSTGERIVVAAGLVEPEREVSE